jgi:hypothetical protein
MGIRNRTPIGTLREQRRSAENLPQVEAYPGSAQGRARIHKAPEGPQDPIRAHDKSEDLIGRLRTVLQKENSKVHDSSITDYLVLRDELARISYHHQLSMAEEARKLIDLEPPRGHLETSSPFLYVVIDGGKKSQDFPMIPKLDRAPSNLDSYRREWPKDQAPRLISLTLLINDDEPQSLKSFASNPSDEAASFTQSSVTYQTSPNQVNLLPKSLVLSLLGNT